MSYIKQLDSIRAIAVLLVIITHWFPKDNFLYALAKTFNGVDIFFTLSGFLITGILLKDRKTAEESGQTKLGCFKNFFLRRVLRIFPLYYLVLMILLFFNPSSDPIDFTWFSTFTSNFYFFEVQQWNILSHTWSLSVEEQFYFIWPWLILFTGRRFLPHAIFAFVVTGIVSQQLVSQNEFAWILPHTCLDALALGGLLAWFEVHKPHRIARVYRLVSALAIVCLGLLVLKNVFHLPYASGRTITAVLTLWMITHILRNREHQQYLFRPLLNNNLLIFLGKMSYGIYLFHFLIPYFMAAPYTWEYEHLKIPAVIKDHPAFWLGQNFIILIAVSWLSYRFVETPILKMKRHFYSREQQAADLAMAENTGHR